MNENTEYIIEENTFFECKNIQKKWDNIKINFSFKADKGTFTSIVGPSGSGKSTVLRIIAGLLKSDGTSSIKLDGKDITNLAPGKRQCGMVFQNASLFLNMTVQDNVAYGLRCMNISKKEARRQAVEFLKLFNMQDFAKRYTETLSGGEAQRIAIARTLIVKPKLVLLDEPLSAMDAPLRRKLAGEIRNLQKTFGFTAVMITHDLNEAISMSDKIILMKDGCKQWEGKPEDFQEDMLAK